MIFRKALFVILALVLFLFSCKKEEEEVPLRIDFVSVNPQTVQQVSDSLVITIRYHDSDGDLGQNNTDTPNAFVSDVQNGIVYGFRIRQLAPDNANVPITGLLNIVVPQVVLSSPTSPAGQTRFSVYVRDRSGNISNTVETGPVTIIP